MNAHTFEGNVRSIHDLKLLFFQTSFEWATASGLPTFTSLHDLYLVFSLFFLTYFSMKLFTNQKIFLKKF